jgi:hypothetical protein
MLLVSLDCLFTIAPQVFSNVYFIEDINTLLLKKEVLGCSLICGEVLCWMDLDIPLFKA